MPASRRRDRGQASLEYVGVLALVAVVLGAGGAAVAAPDLRGSVARALKAGLCRVAGGVCTSGEARAAGYAPCTVSALGRDEHLRVTVAVARLQRGDALAIERRSDGTASVAVLDGWQAGAETGVGVSFTPARLEGQATVGGGVTFRGGKTWEFGSVASAERFAARIAGDEDLRGELRGALPLGGGTARRPRPHATYHEGGVFADAGLDAAAPLGGQEAELHGEAIAEAVLGRRVAGAATTWSVRLSADALAHLGLVLGSLGAGTEREGVLEYTTEHGRPRSVVIRASAAVGGELRVFGQRTDARMLGASLRAASAGAAAGGQAGLAADITLGLDLRDPANRAAVHRLLSARGPGRIAALRGMAARLDAAGALDLAVHRTARRRERAGAGARLFVSLAGELARTTTTRALLRAWSMPPGGPLVERGDCAAEAPDGDPR